MAKKFRQLTEEEKRHICNGCGAKGGWIKPPQFVFKESCDHHDYNYFLGYKEIHRKKADRQFYAAMCRQVRERLWYRRPALYTAAYVYYRAVRLFGRKYFYYGDKEQELDWL
ncbi:MAG: phospholipase [Proteobacteria bacterium]|nr:phospholipase [Pseudomonadota bacterium]